MNMINTIKQFFVKNIKSSPDSTENVSEHSLQLATAALLIEMMRSDTKIGDDERKAISNSIRLKFEISEEETDTLIKLAEGECLSNSPTQQPLCVL